MLTYILDKKKGSPLYLQLYDCIRKDILQGRIEGGERLPSKRSLAEHLGISKISVEAAYAQLLSEGYIISRERSGYFAVSLEQLPEAFEKAEGIEAAKEAASEPGAEDADQAPDASKPGSTIPSAELFPFSVWTRLMRSVILDNPDMILERVPAGGQPELKRAIASQIYRERGMKISPEQIIIGAGNEYFYSLLVQYLGRDRTFAIENPLHRKIDRIYSLSGAGLAAIEMDEQGMRVDGLEESGASVAHITPSHHYPTGIVMPITRRREILRWLSEDPDRYLIEDEYDSEFSSAGRPVPSMQSLDSSGRVIFMNSFSKTISPAFRISYMVLPYGLLSSWQERMGFYSCAVPSFDQLTLARFISDGYYERHLRRMKKHYRQLRQELAEELQSPEFEGKLELRQSDSGLHFLLGFKGGRDCSGEALRTGLKRCGLELPLLSDYYVGKIPAHADRFCIVQYSDISPAALLQGLRLFFDL